MRKIKVLFVDTETSDRVNVRESYDNLELWPHVLQLSSNLQECEVSATGARLGNVLKSMDKYVYYDGEIAEGAAQVNGLTTEILLKEGHPIKSVIKEFLILFNEADVVCAHNTIFDMKVIKAEMLRLLARGVREFDVHLRDKPWIDTMWYGNNICKLKNSRGGRKFPSLSELYAKVVDSSGPTVKLHNAAEDIKVLAECFQGMSNENLFSESHFENIFNKHR